ncbi:MULTISPECIES: glycosyltransferase family 4 protein [Pseudomonas]|uniref:glycosyltransferase family 4 protein n=1 Tax=Pseudomonas TaxID=286 RepID=UPI0015950D09|nr:MULTISPECIES: glycosyltransferase family 4 protein [unclassified Pseudomonas]MCV2230915.1 glycosyltransferase family 4 protein [Pseudomonas sp. AU10]
MSLNIAIVTQYFYPESFIINDIVEELACLGHTVEVFTGQPNYPEGDTYEGYDPAACSEQIYKGSVKVNRVPLRPRKSGGAKNLLLNYLSFVKNGVRYFPKQNAGKQFDAIIVFAVSPITAAIPAIVLKRSSKAHLMVWVQDLWPETLKATGFIKNPLLLKAIGVLVRLIYAQADTVLVQSEAFISSASKYVSKDKLVYYPNSYRAPAPQAKPADGLPFEISQLLLSNFCVVFAGNLGFAQSLETIVDAAKALLHLDCKIVVVGSGSRLDWVQEQKHHHQLHNLELVGRLPSSVMPELFAKSEALLVTLKCEEIFALTIPSKIQAYMAAGKPILAALDGEGARIVAQAGAGLCSPAEDAAALAKNIEALYEATPEKRADYGAAAFRFFCDNYEMKTQCRRLVQIIEERIANP